VWVDGALARLGLSIGCLFAAASLLCIYYGVRVWSVQTAIASLFYAGVLSACIWLCGIWLAILIIPVDMQQRWWLVPVAGAHACIAGFLIWSYRNQGAVLFPPRRLSDFCMVGGTHAFAAALYVLFLKRNLKAKQELPA
jgi:hypothetical protein